MDNKTFLTLYFALYNRENCPECGGKGGDYTSDGDGDITWDFCNCSYLVEKTIEQFRFQFIEIARQEGLKGDGIENLMAEVFEYLGL